jgi:hypothetical protein
LTDTGFFDFSGIWIDSDFCLSNGYFGYFRLMPKSTSINFWYKDIRLEKVGQEKYCPFFLLENYGRDGILTIFRMGNLLADW